MANPAAGRVPDGWQASDGKSHHQKRVVIDDKLASVGGLDRMRWRWDTSVHAAAPRCERLHGLLAQADVDDRYRLMSPSVSEFVTGCINVHRKLMLINDELLLVGSANLNSRSMVLGTECNMAIRAFRARWP